MEVQFLNCRQVATGTAALCRWMIILILLSVNSSYSQTTSDSAALTIRHTPNPSNGSFSQPSNIYKWYYSTAVTNNLDRSLRIIRFGVNFKLAGRWQLPEDPPQVFGNEEFCKWYSQGDSLPGGWLPPGKTAIVNNNWNSWSGPIPPHTRWVYTAVDSLGREYAASARIRLKGAPIPVMHGSISFPQSFRYRSGDDSTWATEYYEDSDWQEIANGRPYPEEHAAGVRWLRMLVEVDTALHNLPLGFSLNCRGAADIYIDGKKVFQVGVVGNSPESEQAMSTIHYPKPGVVAFPARQAVNGPFSQHIIAIRHSTKLLEIPYWSGNTSNLNFFFGDYREMRDQYFDLVRKISFHQMFLIGVFLVFAFIHLLLYLYYPAIRTNLFFAITSCLTCLFVYTYFQDRFFVSNATEELWLVRLGNTLVSLLILAILRFTYEIVYHKAPRQFYLFVLAIAALIFFNWFRPFQMEVPGLIISGLGLAEILRTLLFFALNRKKAAVEGAWIMLAGTAVVVAGAIYQILTFDLDLLPALWTIADFPVLFYSALVLMVAMSIVLSRNFAQTRKSLEAKLLEVQNLSEQSVRQEREKALLEAENTRKSQELEQARQLQLSLLPEKPPEVAGIEIAADMQTATEVGGDYYDFHLAADDTLTIAIGDATGHGMKAGTMVAATKSLFNSLVEKNTPADILKNSTRALKAMNMKMMFMALTIAKIKDGVLQIAAAGMPYARIYRAATGLIEEIEIKAMPLGSFADFPYRQKEILLQSGDTLLLLSDGLEEMFNQDNEMLGEEQVVGLFREAASGNPANIVEHLRASGETWADGRSPEDDVTIVAVKIT